MTPQEIIQARRTARQRSSDWVKVRYKAEQAAFDEEMARIQRACGAHTGHVFDEMANTLSMYWKVCCVYCGIDKPTDKEPTRDWRL